ncbi:MAG TPA: RNA polymerase sigma factor [Bacteroidales bacterium]|nr:RNA polymerase sigma factor [Bacteroidales bacterium]
MVKEEGSEQELLQKIRCGDIKAMKELYNNYSGYLTAVCSRYIDSNDDVRDILQESFIKIYNNINKFEYRGNGALKAWMTRITVNESLKQLKSNEQLELIKPTWDLPDVIEDDDPDFDDMPSSVILDMIRSLPQGYRTVFNLYVFEEKSHKEIASILRIAESSSASQFHRAKGILVRKIREYKSIQR